MLQCVILVFSFSMVISIKINDTYQNYMLKNKRFLSDKFLYNPTYNYADDVIQQNSDFQKMHFKNNFEIYPSYSSIETASTPYNLAWDSSYPFHSSFSEFLYPSSDVYLPQQYSQNHFAPNVKNIYHFTPSRSITLPRYISKFDENEKFKKDIQREKINKKLGQKQKLNQRKNKKFNNHQNPNDDINQNNKKNDYNNNSKSLYYNNNIKSDDLPLRIILYNAASKPSNKHDDKEKIYSDEKDTSTHKEKNYTTSNGYKNHHNYDQSEKEINDDKEYKNKYKKNSEKKNKSFDEKNNHELYDENDKQIKGEKFDERKKYKKGSKTKGYHNVYHKDEYIKDHTFYDELDHHGKFKAYDKAHESYNDENEKSKKGKNLKSDNENDHKKHEEKYKKGYQNQHDTGYKSNHGHDKYFNNKCEYDGKKSQTSNHGC